MAQHTISYTKFVAELARAISTRHRAYMRDFGTPGKAPMYGGDYYTGINSDDRKRCPSLGDLKGFTFKDPQGPVLYPVIGNI